MKVDPDGFGIRLTDLRRAVALSRPTESLPRHSPPIFVQAVLALMKSLERAANTAATNWSEPGDSGLWQRPSLRTRRRLVVSVLRRRVRRGVVSSGWSNREAAPADQSLAHRKKQPIALGMRCISGSFYNSIARDSAIFVTGCTEGQPTRHRDRICA